MTRSTLRLIALAGLSPALLAAMMSSALAHWGHVGELAGHGHWIALGAAAAAAALAVWLHNQENEEEGETGEADADEGAVEGEAA